ncbi:hypothetical protein MPH_02365 [Macrophomina phaseolina MS6]|uniref:Uncharacterized protein n=1 Tax=Macrophomina phaseolina (strain MS6) TaxID=1126212 RepID=K2RCU7_MACPH|nr:hypothetical protein MPH_02365 [Macrophomina phaseolina MS6]
MRNDRILRSSLKGIPVVVLRALLGLPIWVLAFHYDSTHGTPPDGQRSRSIGQTCVIGFSAFSRSCRNSGTKLSNGPNDLAVRDSSLQVYISVFAMVQCMILKLVDPKTCRSFSYCSHVYSNANIHQGK